MSREITVDWPWPGEWESVEDVSAFYKDRLYPALSDYIGGIAESDTYIDHVVGPFTIGNLTKGSVLFAGTNGVVSQDNDDLFWDATNIRLGINVGTSPSVPLDVGGDCKFDGAVTINDANADKDFRVEGSGASYTHLLFADASTNRVGINLSSPLCLTHIRGAVCADYAGVGADTFLLIENDGNVAIQLQAATTGVAFIEFCDDNYNPPAGRVGYDFANTQMEFVVETNEHMWLTTTQLKTDLSNLELSAAGAQLKFTGTAGGGDEGVLYKDSGSLARFGLLFEATNKVVLCNRAANGTVELRANTSTAGAGGEVTVVTVDDTDVTLSDGIGFNLQEDITFTGATGVNLIKFPDHLADALSFKEAGNSYLTFTTINGSEVVTFGKVFSGITGSTIGTLTLADGSITDSSGSISFGDEDLGTTGNLSVGTTLKPGIVSFTASAENLTEYHDTYSTTNGETSIVSYRKSASATIGTKSATASGELLGMFIFHGVDSGSNFDYGAAIVAEQAGAVGTRVPTRLRLYTFSDSGSNNIQLVLSEDGNVGIGTQTFGTNANKLLGMATGVAPTTSPANAFQMYSADIGGAAGKAGVHFRDEEGNIVSIGSGGVLMSGTARVTNSMWVDAAGIKAPTSNPAELISHGVLETPAFQFADAIEANQENVTFSMRVPNRMDRTVAPDIAIGWSADGVSPGNCRWQLEYLWTSPGEDTGAGAQETLPITGTADDTADGLVVSTFTGIDLPSATDACIHCRITRLSADELDTIADTVELHGVCLGWTSNKLGLPT